MNITTSAMPTTSSMMATTQSAEKTSVDAREQINNLKFDNHSVEGVYASVNNLAPFEAKYWPGLNKYGWNTNSIDEYNQNLSDKIIEVRAREYQEFDIAKPYIEFDMNSKESKSKQFFPYKTEEPLLGFNDTTMDMLLHEVEGFQNKNNSQNVVTEDKVFKAGQMVLDRKCPHKGCKLYYNKNENEFKCPCHHSRFNMRGDCISGPACPSNIRI